ncbi:MAG: FtsX-like permease family protein [Elusimicrobiales bacterium]|nr:FtsX-like permease family protein [Elusimicrobiales bacterium]
MKLLLTIAWRNILRHKGKSLVIGAILFTGAFLMTLGNGVVSGMARGIEKNVINGFMGDIVVISAKQKSDNVLLNMMGTSIEPVTDYKLIKPALAASPLVERWLPAGKNMAMLLDENSDAPGFAYLLGVDFAEYRKMFPGNFEVIEGSYPAPGERALLIPSFARDEFYNYYNIWYLPEGGRLVKANLKKEALERLDTLVLSSSVVMMGMSGGMNTTSDIRFPVRGIVRYGALNQIFGHFCLVDIESYRECLGYFTAADMSAQVTKEEKALLSLEGGGLDSLFGGDELEAAAPAAPRRLTERSRAADPADGVYNAVFIKLKPGVPYKKAVKELNAALKAAGADARAVTWNKAAGPMGSMTLIIRSALFIFVLLLFSVAVIIIVNTLTMAAMERASEIGMMRAVGAQKPFIGGMFLGETAILSAVFGGAGILAGVLAVELIPLLKISTTNDMLQLLYGGDIFRPMLDLYGVALAVFQLGVVTVLAALYPMKVAAGITPLEAIARD